MSVEKGFREKKNWKQQEAEGTGVEGCPAADHVLGTRL
jgi:hypothetical protein